MTYRILLVDDNKDDIEFYTRLLTAPPLCSEVLPASNAATAVSLYQQQAIDCVILDYYLVQSNGLQLLAQLAEQSSSAVIPAVILTGDPTQAVQAEAARQGAFNYLIKDNTNTTEQLADIITKTVNWVHQTHS